MGIIKYIDEHIRKNTKKVLTLLEKDAGSACNKNTLLHGESISVVSSGNSEDVALEIISHEVSVNLGAHAPVKEWANVFLIIDFNFLVSACGRVRNVELHLLEFSFNPH